MRLFLIFLVGCSLSAFAWHGDHGKPKAAGDAPQGAPQDYMMAAQAREAAGEIYFKLMKEGPAAEQYAALAEIFFDDSQPLPARFYYELAVAKDPENKALQEGLKKIEDRLTYLDQRFKHFTERSKNEKKPNAYGSMAAIKFHMGYRREGVEILQTAINNFGEDPRIAPLIRTFQTQVANDRAIILALNEGVQKSIENGDVDAALKLVGQMIFVSSGHPDIMAVVQSVEKTKPQSIHPETLALIEEFSKQHVN
ncbi:hypothetical protein SCOR_14600 [Sulfidibacter corallicola]|uniref:Tetratricopeptide repeat protein n=1 Tax=Sulfidibacter corallicola TaxID=2818388 RepID=A0A8A4TWG5_SULCO|nr:hypothetical protein [Sulfidibacter corallicola]QTD54306.1 hypothetical protein J3U87_17820 [Sulfidibacter corallicola]